MEYKRCSRCNTIKNTSEYYSNVGNKDGLCAYCKTCKYIVYKQTRNLYFPKVKCECGKTVFKCYLQKHLLTKLHSSRIESYIKFKREKDQASRPTGQSNELAWPVGREALRDAAIACPV